MKKALVLVYSDLRHDARVSRQLDFLSIDFQVTAAALGNNDQPGHAYIDLHPDKLTFWRKLEIAFWSLARNYRRSWNCFHPISEVGVRLQKESWDLIVANDIDCLPLAFFIKGNSNAKVVVDAHEYSPLQFENLLWWRLIFQPSINWICRTWLSQADLVFTVGTGLAEAYQKNFGVHPMVITNAPPYREIEPTPADPNRIKLVHHGIANPSRRPDLMFELMQHLDHRFELDLYLMTSGYASGRTKNYIKELKERFATNPRIRIHDPLPQHQIVPTLNRYDLGIFLLPPINFNYANALPNKFFDFIQARLAVAIGPSPEMARILKDYGNGVIADDFDPVTLAQKLNALTPEMVNRMKQQSVLAAQNLCAQKNGVIFREAIARLF